MKLPNGYGSIYKLSGKRRKPYAVVVTLNYEDNIQKRKLIATVSSHSEGLKILSSYNSDPYDLDLKNLTFKEAWNKVEKELEILVDNKKMSKSNLDGLSFAYKNHCIPLYNDKLMELKYNKMQDIIDNSTNKFNGNNLSASAKGYIKSVCVKIFNFAIDKCELPLLNNPAIKLDAGVKEKSNKHKPFTDKEMSILWGLQYNDVVKVLLIYCYTGLRPNELFITKKSNIRFDEKYFITGSKTKAGKNRIVPIHPKIEHLIKYFYDNDNDYPFTTFINDFNYGKYKRLFDKLMIDLNFNHTPYDGRHTFATKMKRANANDYILKLIMGHSIRDITEKVYTHREIIDLINEVKKIV